MAAFFAGAALVSVLDGPLLVGLLVGGAAALAWHPLRRVPPWTAAGRATWRARLAALAQAWSAWSVVRRQRPEQGGAPPGRWAEAVPVDPADATEAARFDAAFPVRCEAVTSRVQVWHSTDTGRAYEVALRDAPAGALPGDEGWLSFESGRPRVRPGPRPRRTLN